MYPFAFLCTLSQCWSLAAVSRREALKTAVIPLGISSSIAPETTSAASANILASNSDHEAIEHPFPYSSEWTGTNLPILSLEESVDQLHWEMARWPDPSLRRTADTVFEDYFESKTLKTACNRLRDTAIANSAVGLAAQQCGVNARLVYLQGQPNVLVNPVVLERSPEASMRVWRETCLVLPPEFRATVLRDDWVTVQFQDWKGRSIRRSFHGETSRALQHEMDHDRGILITDHIEEGEMANDLMRMIERNGHEHRMRRAFERYVTEA